jgi:hypothetical protein
MTWQIYAHVTPRPDPIQKITVEFAKRAGEHLYLNPNEAIWRVNEDTPKLQNRTKESKKMDDAG